MLFLIFLMLDQQGILIPLQDALQYPNPGRVALDGNPSRTHLLLQAWQGMSGPTPGGRYIHPRPESFEQVRGLIG